MQCNATQCYAMQLIYSVLASIAARGLCKTTMLKAGVLTAMRNCPLLALVRQASADRTVRK